MEAALMPIQKALRKYGAGRPPALTKRSPAAIVALAEDQRARLQKILESEPGVTEPRITSAAVVLRSDGPPAVVLVGEGKEADAVLKLYAKLAGPYSVAGLMFGVQEGGKTYPFAYLLERSPEGQAALREAFERQMSGAVRRDQA